MTKEEIVMRVLSRTELTRSQAIQAVDIVIQSFSASIGKGEDVFVRGLGTFKIVKKKGKKARDINRGKTIILPDRLSVKFKPGKDVRSAIDKLNNEMMQ